MGESYRQTSELEDVKPGAPALLVPEPDNPHDGNALAVRTLAGTQLGSVKGSTTRTLRRLARQGPFHVMLWALHRDERSRPCAVEVMMWRPGAANVPSGVPEHPPLST